MSAPSQDEHTERPPAAQDALPDTPPTAGVTRRPRRRPSTTQVPVAHGGAAATGDDEAGSIQESAPPPVQVDALASPAPRARPRRASVPQPPADALPADAPPAETAKVTPEAALVAVAQLASPVLSESLSDSLTAAGHASPTDTQQEPSPAAAPKRERARRTPTASGGGTAPDDTALAEGALGAVAPAVDTPANEVPAEAATTEGPTDLPSLPEEVVLAEPVRAPTAAPTARAKRSRRRAPETDSTAEAPAVPDVQLAAPDAGWEEPLAEVPIETTPPAVLGGEQDVAAVEPSVRARRSQRTQQTVPTTAPEDVTDELREHLSEDVVTSTLAHDDVAEAANAPLAEAKQVTPLGTGNPSAGAPSGGRRRRRRPAPARPEQPAPRSDQPRGSWERPSMNEPDRRIAQGQARPRPQGGRGASRPAGPISERPRWTGRGGQWGQGGQRGQDGQRGQGGQRDQRGQGGQGSQGGRPGPGGFDRGRRQGVQGPRPVTGYEGGAPNFGRAHGYRALGKSPQDLQRLQDEARWDNRGRRSARDSSYPSSGGGGYGGRSAATGGEGYRSLGRPVAPRPGFGRPQGMPPGRPPARPPGRTSLERRSWDQGRGGPQSAGDVSGPGSPGGPRGPGPSGGSGPSGGPRRPRRRRPRPLEGESRPGFRSEADE